MAEVLVAAPRRVPDLLRPSLPRTWDERAAKLGSLIYALGRAKMAATETHARAYLAEQGPAEQRTQAGKLAAAEAQLGADRARADLEAYRLLVNAELRLLAPGELGAADD